MLKGIFCWKKCWR